MNSNCAIPPIPPLKQRLEPIEVARRSQLERLELVIQANVPKLEDAADALLEIHDKSCTGWIFVLLKSICSSGGTFAVRAATNFLTSPGNGNCPPWWTSRLPPTNARRASEEATALSKPERSAVRLGYSAFASP